MNDLRTNLLAKVKNDPNEATSEEKVVSLHQLDLQTKTDQEQAQSIAVPTWYHGQDKESRESLGGTAKRPDSSPLKKPIHERMKLYVKDSLGIKVK